LASISWQAAIWQAGRQGCLRSQALPLLSENYDGDAALAGPVELQEEDTLPAAHLKPAVCYVDRFRGAQKKGTAVSVSIATLIGGEIDGSNVEIVVLVLILFRHQSFEQSLHVGEKEWLMLIDDDPGRGVTGLDADEAVPNSRAHYEFRNALGQVDELEWLVGL